MQPCFQRFLNIAYPRFAYPRDFACLVFFLRTHGYAKGQLRTQGS